MRKSFIFWWDWVYLNWLMIEFVIIFYKVVGGYQFEFELVPSVYCMAVSLCPFDWKEEWTLKSGRQNWNRCSISVHVEKIVFLASDWKTFPSRNEAVFWVFIVYQVNVVKVFRFQVENAPVEGPGIGDPSAHL